MKWLGNFLSKAFGVMFQYVIDRITFLGGRLIATMTAMLAIVVVPIKNLLDWASSILEWIKLQIDKAFPLLDTLHFSDFSGYWNAFAPYFGFLDLFIPLGLLTATIATLLAMWAIITLIRLVKSVIPGEN